MSSLKPCIEWPCPNFAQHKGRCEDHARPLFYGTNRSAELPKDWPTRRKYTLIRDEYKCVKCGDPANQVDHIIPGNDHGMDNLQSLCTKCHRSKTAQEGNDAQWGEHRAQKQRRDSWHEEYLRMLEEGKNNE